MRPRSFLGSFALAFVVTLPAAAQAGSTSGTPAVPSGVAQPLSGTTKAYTNADLHLSYAYPASFTDASATIGPAMQATLSQTPGAGPDVTRCVTLPFSAMSSSTGLRVLLLARLDAGCLKKTLKPADLAEVTQGEVRGLTASGAHTQFSQPIAFTTNGRAAEMLRGSFTLPTGQPLHSLVSCVLLKPDVACWQFLASSDEALNEMSAFPVSLDGGAPQPLIPASLVPKP